jgi:hypothetical protein
MGFGLEWHVETSIAWDAIQLWAIRRDGDRRSCITAELSVHPVEPGELVQGPTLRLTPDEAQQLMDGFWRAGFRPRDGAGSLAHVDAQKAHLEDMRRLVFTSPPSESGGSNA